jgi:hypothetical protein
VNDTYFLVRMKIKTILRYMRLVYKLSSIILILAMAAIYPLSFVASVLVGAAGHNRHFEISHYLFFGYSILTAVSLYYGIFVLDKASPFRVFIRCLSIGFVLVAIGLETYFIFNHFFIYKDHLRTSFIGNTIIVLFVLNTVVVCIGLFKSKV